jgi:two-component system chemotaxis response regulator CheB
VLGASTGGPSALLTVLASLPDGFDLPILVVLHISEPFGQAMAEWLDGQLALEVRYARDGERLPTGAPNAARGCVLMAPPGQHLELVGESLRLGEAPERHSCRPSVDVLFESVARSMGGHAIAALLTGMGRDGAQGLMAIKHQGGVTIAQDEATSIVFGMPGEAVKLGAATHVLGLPHIGPAIGRAAQGLPGQREGGRTT